MCADHDLVERAEVFAFCVVSALLNGAGNTMVRLLCFHDFKPSLSDFHTPHVRGIRVRSTLSDSAAAGIPLIV